MAAKASRHRLRAVQTTQMPKSSVKHVDVVIDTDTCESRDELGEKYNSLITHYIYIYIYIYI